MAEKLQPLSENVYCLLHELLVPLKTMTGAYTILRGKVPQIIEEPLRQFGQIGEELHSEVMMLYRDPSKRINLQSADTAAEQLRLLSRTWEKEIEKLSNLISQLRVANVRLEDELLNTILNEYPSKGLEGFSKKVACLKSTQSKHLMLQNGFFDVLQVEREKDQ